MRFFDGRIPSVALSLRQRNKTTWCECVVWLLLLSTGGWTGPIFHLIGGRPVAGSCGSQNWKLMAFFWHPAGRRAFANATATLARPKHKTKERHRLGFGGPKKWSDNEGQQATCNGARHLSEQVKVDTLATRKMDFWFAFR